MRKPAILAASVAAIAVVVAGAFLLSAVPKEDPYRGLVRHIGSSWRGWKVAQIGGRDDPDTLVLPGTKHDFASAFVYFDRQDVPSRLPGVSGTISRKFSYRREKSPRAVWDELFDRVMRRPFTRAVESIAVEEPNFPAAFFEVKQRVGKDSIPNLVQDLGQILGVIGNWTSSTAHDVIILRAELELEAGAIDWVKKDLVQIRRMALDLNKPMQARAEKLRLATRESGPTFLKP